VQDIAAVSETIGIGLVGYGWIGRAHAHALHALNHIRPLARRVRLVSVAGRRPEGVEAAARELGFERWTARWEALVEDPAVDVVANVAANEAHAAPSIAALELGKPVLCEKPLGSSAAEARAMLDAATRAGVPHACGFNYRFVPALRLARELVRSGRLGRLRHFRALYLQDWMAAERPTQRVDRSSGAVLDYSHLVDTARYLDAEPLAVSAQAARFVGEAEDAYAAVCELAGGALGSLEASRCATGWKGLQRIELNGTDGSLWWSMEDLNRLHVFFVEDEREGLGGFRDVLVTEPEHPFLEQWWPPGHVLGWQETLVHEWRDFLSAVIENRPVLREQASFEDGYAAAVLCDAILASVREGRRVRIEEAEAGPGNTITGGSR
jgi:predicted dehydrogenase